MVQEMCILKGFTRDQASGGLQALSKVTDEEIHTIFAPLTDSMLLRNVEEVLEDLFKGKETDGKVLTKGSQLVFMAVYSTDRAVTIMKTLKSLSTHPGDMIFAMITETALKWSFQQYIDHVSKEHEYMKTHAPSADPDMKPV